MDDSKSVLEDGLSLPSNFAYLTDQSDPESKQWKTQMAKVHNDIYGGNYTLNDVQVKSYKLTIKKGDHELGLFGPRSGIPEGVILCRYLGEKVKIDKVNDERFAAEGDKTGIIYSEFKGNIARFINSCGKDKQKVNVKFYESFGSIYVATSQRVAASGELLMDYDPTPPAGSFLFV